MARDTDHLAGGFDTENTGGFLSGLLAEEENFDGYTLLRLGAWGAVSVGAVIVAVMTNQSSIGMRHDQVAAADLARQSQQIQSVAKEGQNEARRLASAIETLNGDRDRLYSRVAVLEQGLDSVTGAIARQNPAQQNPAQNAAGASPQAATPAATAESQPASQNPAPAPVPVAAAPSVAAPAAPTASAAAAAPLVAAPAAAPVAMAPAAPPEKPVADAMARDQATGSAVGQAASNPPTPATPLVAPMRAPPDAAAAKLIRPEAPASTVTSAPMPEVVASVSNDDAEPDPSSKVAVQRTEFGVDVGGANSLSGLRALWRGLLKSNSALSALRPVIAVKENRNGLGLQLRLIAGPLGDAATAAKICAALTESQRACETAVFDGQRLAMKADETPVIVRPAPRRRGSARHGVVLEEAPKKPEPSPSTLSLLFKRDRAN